MRDKSGKREEVEHSSRRWEFLLSSCSLICCAILSCVKPLQFRDTRIIASREWTVNGISNPSWGDRHSLQMAVLHPSLQPNNLPTYALSLIIHIQQPDTASGL